LLVAIMRYWPEDVHNGLRADGSLKPMCEIRDLDIAANFGYRPF
jgi:hypothetical protein